MEKYADLIFKKLHSELNQDEKNLFDKLNAENESFRLAFKKQKIVDVSIEKSGLINAPIELKGAVLKSVLQQKFYSQAYDSFNGIKYIIGGLLSLSLFMIIYFLTTKGWADTGSESMVNYLNMDKMLESFSFNTNINMLPIALLLITGLMIVWLDGIFKNRIFGLRKSY